MIIQIILTKKENKFLFMKEEQFYEGSALNVFGENYNYQGKKFKKQMQYNTFGTSINYLLKNNILEIPNYIKIDVDGLEHMILSGANLFLSNKKIISINIEINENFKKQFKNVLKIMKKNNFKVYKKFRSQVLEKNSKFDKTFNYIFIRQIDKLFYILIFMNKESKFIFISDGYKGGATNFLYQHMNFLKSLKKNIILIDDNPNNTYEKRK